MKIEELKREIPFKWRVQSFSKFKPQASCVAYIDARDAMDLLDEVCGPDKWQDDYKTVGNQLIAGIGIKFDDEWVWKWDTGTESNMEAEKGQMSDAFKRACVKWGIGRFLYRKKIIYLDTNEKKEGNNYPYPVDKNGKRIWDITEYINSDNKPKEQTPSDLFLTLKESLESCDDEDSMTDWSADNKQDIDSLNNQEKNKLRDLYRGMEKVFKK